MQNVERNLNCAMSKRVHWMRLALVGAWTGLASLAQAAPTEPIQTLVI